VTDLELALRRVVSDLTDEEVGYALVGGLAVSVRAEPRLTRDTDFAVSVDSDDMAESIIRRLTTRGYLPGAVVEHRTGRLATVRMSHSSSVAMVTDLLFASCGIEPEVVASAERLEVLPGLKVPVATTGHLIAMKLLAQDDRLRPTDADDLSALAALAREPDWAEARSAVGLIAQRGFARDRDLGAALTDLQAKQSEEESRFS
jgi:hypothetical protein